MARRRPIQIGRWTFGTKAEAKRHIREMIDRYKNGERLSEEDEEFAVSLLVECHRAPETKIGVGVDHIYIAPSIPWRSRGFWVKRIDGSDVAFSWTDCIDGYSPQQNFNAACRSVIKAQKYACQDEYFLRRQDNTKRVPCEHCARMITREEAHVDHENPQFIEIVMWFIQAEAITDVCAVELSPGGSELFFVDRDLATRFAGFHRERAKLRIVCRQCNLRRRRLRLNVA